MAANMWVDDIYTIEIDRSNPPTYPPWVKGPLYPEHEINRPAKYDLRKDVETWRHHEQTLLTGGEVGSEIYRHIVRWGEISSHLSLADLFPIQEMGIEIYQQLYDGMPVVAWGGVVEGVLPRRRNRVGRPGANLSVPYLCLHKGEIVQDWEQLDQVFGPDNFALRFREGVL